MKVIFKDWFDFQNMMCLQKNVPKQFKMQKPASIIHGFAKLT